MSTAVFSLWGTMRSCDWVEKNVARAGCCVQGVQVSSAINTVFSIAPQNDFHRTHLTQGIPYNSEVQWSWHGCIFVSITTKVHPTDMAVPSAGGREWFLSLQCIPAAYARSSDLTPFSIAKNNKLSLKMFAYQ